MTPLESKIATYLQANVGLIAPLTAQAYAERLGRFAAYIGEQRVTPLLCKSYLSQLLTAGLSRRTAISHYATIRSFFGWLQDSGVVKSNPVPKMRRFVVPHTEKSAMSQDEVDRLLALFRVERRDWYYATLCGWETGLRLGDVASLLWDEVSLENLVIRRAPIKTRRFGKFVEIPISETLAQAMSDCRPHDCANPLFVCPILGQKHAYKCGSQILSAEFRLWADKAGVSKSFHSLRHGLVSRLLNKGVSPAVVQAFTGHSLKQLQTYSHIDMATKRAAVDNQFVGKDRLLAGMDRQRSPLAPGLPTSPVHPGPVPALLS